MIRIQNPDAIQATQRRLARIEGQLRGVQKMINESRDCREIVQQLIAIRSAVQAASLNFMQDVASDCLLHQADSADPAAQQAMLADLIRMLGKVS